MTRAGCRGQPKSLPHSADRPVSDYEGQISLRRMAGDDDAQIDLAGAALLLASRECPDISQTPYDIAAISNPMMICRTPT